jgi:DnaA family protein
MKQLLLDLAPPPQPTLENFVVGPNAEVLAQLRALLSGQSHERFVYLWGGTGCGKTHLLQALAMAAKEQRWRVCQSSAASLCCEEEAAACDLVLVDDVLSLDAAGQSGLFNSMNRMRDGSGLLVVTGPFAPIHLNIRQDLSSRLAQCLVFQVKCLSDEDKAQALMTHALGRGFTLPNDVATYLLRKWKRDIPALLAALDAVDRYSLEVKRPVTVPLTREVLARLPKS